MTSRKFTVNIENLDGLSSHLCARNLNNYFTIFSTFVTSPFTSPFFQHTRSLSAHDVYRKRLLESIRRLHSTLYFPCSVQTDRSRFWQPDGSSCMYVKCKIVSSHTRYSFLRLLRARVRAHISLSPVYLTPTSPTDRNAPETQQRGQRRGSGFCGLLSGPP